MIWRRDRAVPGHESVTSLTITPADFERIHPKIVATVRRQGASEDEAEEISQEAFLRAHRGWGTFEHSAQLDTWIVGIAKNVWLQTCRDRRRLKRAADEVSLSDETVQVPSTEVQSASPEAMAEARQELARAKREIALLSDDTRRALELSVQGFSYAEIGAALRVSVGRVSSLVYQGRQTLLRKLANHPTNAAP